MRIKIRNPKDLYAGLVFIFFGVFALLMARSYPMGNAMRMGPGYFPSILGGSLALLGLVVAARSLW
ncbi:MAG: tripartite tricarboxylate transporter TctB family protein, partial [Deltaproteobacteria bacterium]|nr:tripartite tricarboxylate transporter TctB family protein [Deltaproteobacteria bacterium]